MLTVSVIFEIGIKLIGILTVSGLIHGISKEKRNNTEYQTDTKDKEEQEIEIELSQYDRCKLYDYIRDMDKDSLDRLRNTNLSSVQINNKKVKVTMSLFEKMKLDETLKK